MQARSGLRMTPSQKEMLDEACRRINAVANRYQDSDIQVAECILEELQLTLKDWDDSEENE